MTATAGLALSCTGGTNLLVAWGRSKRRTVAAARDSQTPTAGTDAMAEASKRTGADALVQALAALGVETCFANPGYV